MGTLASHTPPRGTQAPGLLLGVGEAGREQEAGSLSVLGRTRREWEVTPGRAQQKLGGENYLDGQGPHGA